MTDLFDLSDLEILAGDCLVRAGLQRRDAQIIAREVALAEAVGDSASGFEALLRDIRLFRYGRIRGDANPSLKAVSSSILHVDADHGFAALALANAMPDLVDRARKHGLAMLHLTNASAPGVMASSLGRLADAKLAGVAINRKGLAYAIQPSVGQVIRLDLGVSPVITALLSAAPQVDESPLEGPVLHTGWLAALDPDASSAEDLLDLLPVSTQNQSERTIALASDLLAQIVNA